MSQVIESRLLAETDKLLKGELAERVNRRAYWLRSYTTDQGNGPYVCVTIAFEHPTPNIVAKVPVTCTVREYGRGSCFVAEEWPIRVGDALENLEQLLLQPLESAA